jgi:hypothetical protein
MKYGFDSVERFKSEAQAKFSLLEEGILDKASTRLLLVNVRYSQSASHVEMVTLTDINHIGSG